jgi:hypothetical protein
MHLCLSVIQAAALLPDSEVETPSRADSWMRWMVQPFEGLPHEVIFSLSLF